MRVRFRVRVGVGMKLEVQKRAGLRITYIALASGLLEPLSGFFGALRDTESVQQFDAHLRPVFRVRSCFPVSFVEQVGPCFLSRGNC